MMSKLRNLHGEFGIFHKVVFYLGLLAFLIGCLFQFQFYYHDLSFLIYALLCLGILSVFGLFVLISAVTIFVQWIRKSINKVIIRDMLLMFVAALPILVVTAISIKPAQPKNMSEQEIESEISKANYCSVKSDCENIGEKCPFGCNILVNKNEVGHILTLMASYAGPNSQCVYKCMYMYNYDCVDQKCTSFHNKQDGK